MKKEKNVVVVRAVFKFGEKYLVVDQQNASGKSYQLFPGGHINPGESLVNGVIREVNEELNIEDTKPGQIIFFKETLSPFDRNYEFFFECRTAKNISEVKVKQKEYTGYEKIKNCRFETEKNLKQSSNFFPEGFFSEDKYQYLELDLPEYIRRFGNDNNINKLKA